MKKLAFGVILLLVVFLVPVLLPAPGLWGMNLFQYLPKIWALLLLVLGVVYVAMTSVSKDEGALAGSSEKRGEESIATESIIFRRPLVTASVFGLLYFLVSMQWSLLGDSALLIGYNFRFVEHGEYLLSWREPLSGFILQSVTKIYSLFSERFDSLIPFRIVGASCGFLWCFFALKMARLVSSDKSWQLLCFGLLMTAGGSLFFHGYVELYAQSYVASLAVLYYCLRLMKLGGTIRPVVISLLIAILMHIQNVLLLPAIFLGIGYSRGSSLNVSRKHLIICTGLLVAFYAAWQIIAPIPLNSAHNPFIPTTTQGEFRYTLFSFQHLLDILSEHFVLAPVAVVGLISIFLESKKITSDSEIKVVLVALFFLEAFLIGGNMIFGLARDWDVVAFIGPLLTILFMLSLVRVPEFSTRSRQVTRLLIPVSLGIGVVWLFSNINLATAERRFADLLEIYEPLIETRNTHYGYENLRKIQSRTDPAAEIATIRKMTALMPWPVTTVGAVRIASKSSLNLSESGVEQLHLLIDDLVAIKSDSILTVEESGSDRLRADPPHSSNPVCLADVAISLISFEATVTRRISRPQAEMLAARFIEEHPKLPQGYELRSFLSMSFEPSKPEIFAPLALQAIRLDSMRPRPLIYYSLAKSLEKNLDSALLLSRKVLSLDPNWTDAWNFHLSLLQQSKDIAIDTENFELLRSVLQRAASETGLYTTPQRVALAKGLLAQLAEVKKEHRENPPATRSEAE